jgi:hypothetical protein
VYKGEYGGCRGAMASKFGFQRVKGGPGRSPGDVFFWRRGRMHDGATSEKTTEPSMFDAFEYI